MERLFIYGTLGPGGPNEHIMRDIGGEWQLASTRGYLHTEGWGADMGYPGIIPDPNGEEVHGHVFTSSNLKDHWDNLDEFEGHEYERRSISIKLENGEEAEAFVYALKPRT